MGKRTTQRATCFVTQKGALRDIQKTAARETTCFAALLQNELNSDIDLFTTHESKLF